MKVRYIIAIALLAISNLSVGQGVEGFRLNGRIAAAVPLGTLAETGTDALQTGLASPGIDFNTGFELFLTKVIDLGVRVGYSVYQVDDQAFNDVFINEWGFDPQTNTTSYQNIYFLGGGGLNIPVIKEKFDIQPYMYAGLGIFKSAGKEAFGTDNGIQYYYSNESNYQPSLHLQPGASFNIYINDFAEFQVYSEYNHSDITVEETIQAQEASSPVNQDVDYSLSAIHVGAGLTFRF